MQCGGFTQPYQGNIDNLDDEGRFWRLQNFRIIGEYIIHMIRHDFKIWMIHLESASEYLENQGESYADSVNRLFNYQVILSVFDYNTMLLMR